VPARGRLRWAWWLLAYASLGLGLAGTVLPGLPTVPFVLLAAYAAGRGSQRLHARLLADPRFGPLIRDWSAHGAVSRRAKRLATVAMAGAAGVLVVVVPGERWWAAALPLACMLSVGAWLWRRPEPPADD
jgi:uncharacterized protein